MAIEQRASVLRGRPRDPGRDEAITRATLELVLEKGFDLSIEEVAERAGVAKTSVYRRFPCKEELVIAALERATAPQPLPDTGSFRGDLLDYARRRLASAEALSSPLLIARLIGDLWRNRQLMALFAERILAPARAPVDAIIERGIERGELRDDLDRELILDLLGGGFVYRLMITGDPLAAEGRIEAYLDAALEGIGRRDGRAR